MGALTVCPTGRETVPPAFIFSKIVTEVTSETKPPVAEKVTPF